MNKKIRIQDLCSSATFVVYYKGFLWMKRKAIVTIWFSPTKIHLIDNKIGVELGFKLGDNHRDAIHWIESNNHEVKEIKEKRWINY